MPADNVALIQGIYDAFAKGDVPAVLGAFSPDIVWHEAEGFPYADHNPYIGPQAVLEGVFMRLATEWDGFAAGMGDLSGGGDTVLAQGRYTGTYKATGKAMNAQAAHVWRIKDGKVVGFQQYIDTAQVAGVVGG